jgi:hypothetical protein
MRGSVAGMDTREPKRVTPAGPRPGDREGLDLRPRPSLTRLLEAEARRRVDRVMQAARQVRLR